MHAALAAVNPDPGDEIITTCHYGHGSAGALFCTRARFRTLRRRDPKTYNVTAQTVEECLRRRTRGDHRTHLFGNPARMGEIMELARAHEIPVIEDCAQGSSPNTTGGTSGRSAPRLLQSATRQHITTGEAG